MHRPSTTPQPPAASLVWTGSPGVDRQIAAGRTAVEAVPKLVGRAVEVLSPVPAWATTGSTARIGSRRPETMHGN